jgi:hypothetical protein
VPLEVSPALENLPVSFALIVSRLGERVFQKLAFILPMAADFEYLDALPVDTERKIKLGANMWWWAPPFDELGDQLLASLCFEFTERQRGVRFLFCSDRVSQCQRRCDSMQAFNPFPSAEHMNSAVVEHPPKQRLVNIHRLDLVHVHFRGMA